MADNLSRDNYQIDFLSIEAINTVLRRLQDRLDEIEGLRGEIQVYDVVNTNTGSKHTDENGTIIHGFGDI